VAHLNPYDREPASRTGLIVAALAAALFAAVLLLYGASVDQTGTADVPDETVSQ
jgi:hypothetical protein